MFLQRWLDAAWQEGFDRMNAEQQGGFVYGTSKWVGIGEGYALACLMGLRSKVVTVKADDVGVKRLGDFLWRYFSTPWEEFQVEEGAGEDVEARLFYCRSLTSFRPILTSY